jgi:hypothetical protein
MNPKRVITPNVIDPKREAAIVAIDTVDKSYGGVKQKAQKPMALLALPCF